MTLYMIIQPVHLLPDVKCECNSYIIMYLKLRLRSQPDGQINSCGVAGDDSHDFSRVQ